MAIGTVACNPTGRRLLKRFHSLKAELTVATTGAHPTVVAIRTLTFH